MSDYIMDMRQALNKLSDKENKNQEILDILDNDYELRNKIFLYDSDHYPSVYLEDLKVGDRLYIFDTIDGYIMSQHHWLEMEITHIYGGVYFYKLIDTPSDDDRWSNERHFVKGSLLALVSIYPKKVVITKDYQFTCTCPRVEFIYDDDMNNKYSSIYSLKEDKKF